MAGGSPYAAMAALDLLPPERTAAATLDLHGTVNGTKVVILGAGLAGMCAAYELGKHGYDCHILEARARPGGRSWTVRGGTTETEIGGTPQTATFSEGLYLNPGPARVSHNHVTMDYYREFEIAVQPFINDNFNAYYYSKGAGGLKVRQRQARFDMLGYTSELLAKAASCDALDVQLDKVDKDRLLTYLHAAGNLDRSGDYKGSGQAGYSVLPGAYEVAGTPLDPLGFETLLRSGFAMNPLFTSEFDQQPTMVQPVGGMDQLPMAMARRLGGRITYQAVVQQIRRTTSGVRIVYRNPATKAESAVEGVYCICTIPLSVLRKIPADFAPNVRTAIASIEYESATKVGLEFSRRFWEEDDRIFGGISQTDDDITQIMYPNFDFFAKRGVAVGAYAFDAAADRLGALSPRDRIQAALEQGGKIHPTYAQEFSNGFSVAWRKIPYNEGAWVGYTEQTRKMFYPTLCAGDGPFYFAGEHMSYINGWQAGALESARAAVTRIHEHARANA